MLNKYKKILLVGLFILVATSANAMFLAEKRIIFSEVKGLVLDQGNVVVGAEIERQFYWHWSNERKTERVKTDGQGRFHFSAVQRRSLFPNLLIHEPVIKQDIVIYHNGQRYEAWSMYKRDYDINGELDGQAIFMRCALEDPLRVTRINGYRSVYGICQLNVPYDIKWLTMQANIKKKQATMHQLIINYLKIYAPIYLKKVINQRDIGTVDKIIIRGFKHFELTDFTKKFSFDMISEGNISIKWSDFITQITLVLASGQHIDLGLSTYPSYFNMSYENGQFSVIKRFNFDKDLGQDNEWSFYFDLDKKYREQKK